MSLRALPLILVLGGTPLLADFNSTNPVQAQVANSQQRAFNLAREVAVRENGGLSVYRPEKCMYATATGGGPCLIRDNANGYTFRFLGGSPGWQESQTPPSTETELLIAPDGRSVVEIIYNGPPR